MSDAEIALRNNRKCQKKHQKTFALLNFKHVLCNPIFRRKLYKKKLYVTSLSSNRKT